MANGFNQAYANDVAIYEDADYISCDVVKLHVFEEVKTVEAKVEAKVAMYYVRDLDEQNYVA